MLKSKHIENILSVGDKAMGSSFVEKLRYWRQTLSGSSEELKELQSTKLANILEFASEKSPYYKGLEIVKGNDPYSWLRNFPVLAKQTFRDKAEEFLTTDNLDELTSITSSGSTGAPSKVYFSADELSSNRALQIIWWEWAGYKFGDSVLQTGVNMKRSFEKKLKDFLLNTKYIDAVSHDEGQIKAELELLLEQPKKYFVGYASSIFLFAMVANKYGIKGVKFDGIISIGEKLLPSFKDEIEKAFKSSIYDTYGASEGFLIASQCKKGRYHVMSPHLILELLDEEGQEVGPGEMGRVVLTSLDNYTMPLIRYEIGDLAVKATETSCECGLELPLLGEIVGRITEFILTPGGKFITVQTVVRLMKKFELVNQYKIIQTDKNRLEIELVSSEKLNDDYLLGIGQEYEKVLGERLNISYKQVQVISKAKTGKFQLIENRIK